MAETHDAWSAADFRLPCRGSTTSMRRRTPSSGHGCCCASGRASGRLDDLGLTAPEGGLQPQRMTLVDLLGEAVLVTVDADGELHAHANVCRHRGSQLVPTVDGLVACAL